MSDAASLAIDFIRKRGSLRTPAIAVELGIGEAAVDAMLAPACARGELTTCTVEAGGRRVIEYRLSISGGGKLVAYAPNAPKATPAAKNAQARAAHLRIKTETTFGTDLKPGEINETLARPIRVTAPAPGHRRGAKGEQKVNLVDKIVAAFKKHGPMTTAQLREHHDHPHITTYCSQLAKRGVLGRLGGGKRTTIYGLPDQKAPETTTDAPPRSIHRSKAGKHAKKRAGGGSVAMRRKPDLKHPKKAFRPALAADGAILFLGAYRGDFEIRRAEARVVVDLVRRLSGDELAQAVDFIEQLDGAKVGA